MDSLETVDALLAFVGTLGTAITVTSGLAALFAIFPPRLPPEKLAEAVNRGLAWGFVIGMPTAGFAFGVICTHPG